VFNNCYGQVAYGWQLSQKAYVLDKVANNYYMTAVNPPVLFQTIYELINGPTFMIERENPSQLRP